MDRQFNLPHGNASRKKYEKELKTEHNQFRRRRQWTDYLEQSAACTMVTRFVTERLQKSIEDISAAHNRPAPLRLFRGSGAGYKYSDLLTYLLTYLLVYCNAVVFTHPPV